VITEEKIVYLHTKQALFVLRAFGPVPNELISTGEKVCSTMNMGTERYLPKGYHPKALDSEGIEFLGGGYYCVKKSN
jgi:hypothetical protein